MEDVTPIDTHIGTNSKLDIDEPNLEVNEILYRSIIDSLLYLIASWPNIVFSVRIYARFQARRKESHLKYSKRILRYLKKIGPSTDSFELVRYTNTDYAGYQVDQKSTSGMT